MLHIINFINSIFVLKIGVCNWARFTEGEFKETNLFYFLQSIFWDHNTRILCFPSILELCQYTNNQAVGSCLGFYHGLIFTFTSRVVWCIFGILQSFNNIVGNILRILQWYWFCCCSQIAIYAINIYFQFLAAGILTGWEDSSVCILNASSSLALTRH